MDKIKSSFRIAHLCTSKAFGGLEMNVLRLSRWMNARGHHSIIIARNQLPLIQSAEDEHIETVALDPSIPYFNLNASLKLSRIISKNRIDALFVHTSKDINHGAIAKSFSSNKFILIHVQHMQIGIEKKDWLHTWEYNKIDAWITLLPSMRENILRFTNMIQSKVYGIPLGIEIDQFNPHSISQSDARREFDIPENVFLVGVVGRLDYGKGQEYLIRAIHELEKQHIIVHALFVGETTHDEKQIYLEKLYQLVTEFGLKDQIHFRPFTKNPASAYAAIDIFCLTSISETYGMVTIEAMAMQCAIIATNSSGTPDIIQNNHNGRLVSPQNVDAFVDAIKRMKSDPSLRTILGEQARKDVEEKFSHNKQCESYEKLLQEISARG